MSRHFYSFIHHGHGQPEYQWYSGPTKVQSVIFLYLKNPVDMVTPLICFGLIDDRINKVPLCSNRLLILVHFLGYLVVKN